MRFVKFSFFKIQKLYSYASLFLASSDGLTTSTGGLGVLTSNTETPVVSETSVSTDLLKTLQILTELVIKLVDEEVGALTVSKVSLSVKEPSRDLVLGGVLDDSDDSFELFNSKLTSTLGHIDISLLADQVSVSATNTSNGGQSVHDLDLTIDVSAEKTIYTY